MALNLPYQNRSVFGADREFGSRIEPVAHPTAEPGCAFSPPIGARPETEPGTSGALESAEARSEDEFGDEDVELFARGEAHDPRSQVDDAGDVGGSSALAVVLTAKTVETLTPKAQAREQDGALALGANRTAVAGFAGHETPPSAPGP